MTRHRFYTADVFAETRFGGNQLAVFPDARRIPDSLLRPQSDARVLPIDIERAFAEANPGLRPDMMSVQCGRRGVEHLPRAVDVREALAQVDRARARGQP